MAFPANKKNEAESGGRRPDMIRLPEARDRADGARPAARPAGPRDASREKTASLHIAPTLWILLGLSVVFIVGVQRYVHRVEASSQLTVAGVPELPLIAAYGPLDSVQRNDLELRWDGVQGAAQYDLRIFTERGAPVVDPAPVWSTTWRPTEELLPGLGRGAYRWTVEAVDTSGKALARSAPMKFAIL